MSRRQSYDVSTSAGQKRLMAESIGMTYIPDRRIADRVGDYGSSPAGNGLVRMVPSGDIVTAEECIRRLKR